MDKREGQQLGNYRLLRLLGQGGFASVYLGEHVYLGTYAALKVLSTLRTREEEAAFVKEAQLLVRLTHPHIIRVFDFAVQDGTPFLVMEYAPGGTLRMLHPMGSRLSPNMLLPYVQQVASALQYAHDQHFIHRDIKPENMLLGSHAEVLLSDFGLAIVISATGAPYSTQDMARVVAGTAYYLAPEQLRGHPQVASDQYALGIVVYEWLCGAPPFRGTPVEIAMQHLSMPPPPLQAQVADISPVVEEVLLRTLAKDPAQRFAQVRDFALAFEQAVLKRRSDGSAPIFTVERDREQRLIGKVSLTSSPLLGREHDLARIESLLVQPEVRLLTLVGPGGVGKTRLALQIAAVLGERFADGVCMVALADISDVTLIPSSIAEALGIQEGGTQHVVDRITRWLTNRRLLLVLDNFEHVVGAAPLIEEMLSACPLLTIVITSREILRLHVEHVYTVPPLALPDLKRFPPLEQLATYAAVALFVQRAQTVQASFQLTPVTAEAVAKICALLDGLPLALELAAARMKLLSPQALLARLSRRFEVLTGGARTLPLRQQTLHNTLIWSYNLLDQAEKRLFRQLAVFVGTFPLQAVEAVCYPAPEQASFALDEVTSLLDKSLLWVERDEQRQEEPRLRQLMTVREFGLECLEHSGETDQARNAHAAYYLALVEEAEPHLTGSEQVIWLTRLDQEHENLRTALLWLLERAPVEGVLQAERALRLCVALYLFWWTRGYLNEGATFLERALHVREGVEGRIQARVLHALAMHMFILYGVERAESLSRESQVLYRELEDTAGVAVCLFLQGRLARNRCQYDTAYTLLQEGITLFKSVSNTRQSSLCLAELALVLVPQGKYQQAHTLLEESLALARTCGDRGLIGWALYQLALVLFLSCADSASIQTLAEEGIAHYRKMEDQWHMAYGQNLLGEMHLAQGELLLARELCEGSLATFKEMGSQVDSAEFQLSLARVLVAQRDFPAAHALYEESLTILLELDNKEPVPACLEGLGTVMARQGAISEAARQWGRAEALREAIGAPIPPVYRAEYEREVTAARAQAGEEAFATAWEEGRAISMSDILAPLEQLMPQTSPKEAPSPPVSGPSPSPTYPDELTKREVEVLRLVAQGWTDAQIAEHLVISPRTVNKHLTTMYRKIGVSSRSAATRYAFEHGLA